MMTEVRWDRDRTFTVKEHLHTKVGFVPGFGCGKAHSHYHGNQCLEGREFSNNQGVSSKLRCPKAPEDIAVFNDQNILASLGGQMKVKIQETHLQHPIHFQ